MATELTLLGWSVLVLGLHIAVQGIAADADRGLRWNAGPRDDPPPPGRTAARAARALANFLETYPAFVALVLGLAVTERTGGIAQVGAIAWFASRIVHLPLYLYGVPVVRSIVWGVSMLGLLLMLIRFL